MKKLPILAGFLGASMLAAAPFAAFASNGVSVNANVGLGLGRYASSTFRVGAHASTTSATALANGIARANQEIQRRLTNLNALLTRVGQMKNISSTELASLQTSINAQISAMNTLEAKIDADTDITTLRTDIQSITKAYRIYMLVLPQSRIIAAADRVETIVSDIQTLAPKLQARITAAASAGHDMTAANAAYADMQAKITDANTQVTAAASEVVNLQPDNGNTTIEASNTAALKDAQSKLQTAAADLKAARADITTILNAVRGLGGSSSGTSTPDSNVQ